MLEKNINEATARILLSTKRKSRQYSLFEIANDVLFLKEQLGGMSKVAKVIGITSGMLNQFISVLKLPDEIIDLINKRKINSVTLAHHLAKFNHADAIQLAKAILKDGLTSQELRIILPFRKKHPNEPLDYVIERVLKSKNIKVSVIRIPQNNIKFPISELENKIKALIGFENFFAIEISDNNVDVKITKQGEKDLRRIAKSEKLSLQEYINQIIN